MSCKSQIQPLQFRFSNVTLTNDGLANTNGIALQVGSPGQIVAFTPSTLLNNTVLANRASCGSNANTSCIESIGGGYDPSSSSSFRASTADAWNGSIEATLDLLINTPSTYFNDLLTVGSDQVTQELPGFPLLLSPLATAVYSQLGIGSDSTFINRLAEAGLVPSRSWSFFAGVYSRIRAGSLIIGGYADRFYQGTLHTKNVTDACGTCFDVVEMVYQQNGTTVSLMPDGGGPLTGIVDPYYPVMIVSDDMFYKFGNATNGTYQPEIDLHGYSTNDVPSGNITVTLGNGLVTTIPNNALFNPPAYDNGILANLRNQSIVYGVLTPWAVVVAKPPTVDVAVLGMPYAAMVYLMRDYERHTVSIAAANQDAQIGGDATTICSIADSSRSGSNHTGAIAGGVVGGLLGVGLAVLLAWFLLRRRKRRTAKRSRAKIADSWTPEAPADMLKPEMSGEGAEMSHEQPAESMVHTHELSTATTKGELPTGQTVYPAEMSTEGKAVRSELPA